MKIKFVLCINNEGYQASLEKGKVYRVIKDKNSVDSDLIKIIDESGEDYLYSREMFVPVDVPETAIKALVL